MLYQGQYDVTRAKFDKYMYVGIQNIWGYQVGHIVDTHGTTNSVLSSTPVVIRINALYNLNE